MQVTLYTDGGARGNPGIAGAGIHIVDSGGALIEDVIKPLGIATNNEAEYHAVITGFEKIIEHFGAEAGELHVTLKLDSELVGKQLLGAYKVKEPRLKPLHECASELMEHFSSVSIRTIPREQNKEADRLSNLAMDQVL